MSIKKHKSKEKNLGKTSCTQELFRDYCKGHAPVITNLFALTQNRGALSLFGVMDPSGSLMKPMDLVSEYF